MRKELETYDVGDVSKLFYYLDWLEKGYDKKIPEIITYLKGVKLEKSDDTSRVVYG